MDSSRKNYLPKRAIIMLMALSAIYLCSQALFIGIARIGGSSEAREAQVVDVLLRAGSGDLSSLILPLRNGVIPSKPPLYHWLSALTGYLLGGSNEFTLRFSSEIAAIICLIAVSLATFSFARLTSSYHLGDHPSRAALIAFIVLSLSYGFFQMSGQAMVDMTFVACLWCSLAAVAYVSDRLISFRRDHSLNSREIVDGISPSGCFAFWFFCAIAVLARGPIGLALPIALVGFALFCTCGLATTLKVLLRPRMAWLALLIPLAWYIAAYRVGGEKFIDRQLLFENVKRFSGGDFVNTEPWWFYIPSLLRVSFPWGVVLFFLVFRSFVSDSRSFSYPAQRLRVRWLPTLMLLFGVVLLSLSSGKRHSYLIPLLPLIAVQLGIEFSSLFEGSGSRFRGRLIVLGKRISAILIGVCLVVLFGLILCSELELGLGAHLQESIAVSAQEVVPRLGIILLGAIGLATVSLRRSILEIYAGAWFLALILMTVTVNAGLSIKAHLKGFNDMALSWLATAGDGDNLAVFKHPYDEYFDPILYYVHREVRIVALDSVARECAKNVVYAAKQSWLDDNQGRFRGDIVRIVTVRERSLEMRSDVSRDLVFFRCFKKQPAKERSDDGDLASDFLRDAAL